MNIKLLKNIRLGGTTTTMPVLGGKGKHISSLQPSVCSGLKKRRPKHKCCGKNRLGREETNLKSLVCFELNSDYR